MARVRYQHAHALLNDLSQASARTLWPLRDLIDTQAHDLEIALRHAVEELTAPTATTGATTPVTSEHGNVTTHAAGMGDAWTSSQTRPHRCGRRSAY